MRPFVIALAVMAIGLLPISASAANAAKPLSDAERSQIENVVREFLTKKEPETVMKAVQEMQRRQEEESNKKTQAALTSNKDKLLDGSNGAMAGNPKGDVTVVEFFDYQCGHCKSASETIIKLLDADKDVKVVYKDFPVLGGASSTAAKAALAVARQGKYEKFHNALLSKKDRITNDLLIQTAKDVGADADKMQKDMEDQKIESELQAILDLGAKIGVQGTPTFIIGNDVYPGAMSLEQLKEAVSETRKAAKK